MANISITRRERNPWIAIAAAVLIALLAWFLWGAAFGVRRREAYVITFIDTQPLARTDAGADPMRPAAVSDYLQFVSDAHARDGMNLDHDFAAGGITRLAAAIAAVALRDTVAGGALRLQITDLRQRATAIQRDPAATTHALQMREAFMIAASIIAELQQRRFPGLRDEASGIVAAATAITAERPLLDQKDGVRQFFDRAAAVLRRMIAEATAQRSRVHDIEGAIMNDRARGAPGPPSEPMPSRVELRDEVVSRLKRVGATMDELSFRTLVEDVVRFKLRWHARERR